MRRAAARYRCAAQSVLRRLQSARGEATAAHEQVKARSRQEWFVELGRSHDPRKPAPRGCAGPYHPAAEPDSAAAPGSREPGSTCLLPTCLQEEAIPLRICRLHSCKTEPRSPGEDQAVRLMIVHTPMSIGLSGRMASLAGHNCGRAPPQELATVPRSTAPASPQTHRELSTGFIASTSRPADGHCAVVARPAPLAQALASPRPAPGDERHEPPAVLSRCRDRAR